MAKKILVAVAWPYANGDLHVGHLAGAYLPADIFARYHRLVGNEVLMVSGTDSHGTPITVKADKEGVSPREIFERYHNRFLETQKIIGISYDLFTNTDTPNHYRVSQDLFLRLLEQDCLHIERQQQYFSETLQRFLPDRYVEGTCPHCGYADARGDQCDNCGQLLDALELKNPRCKIDQSTPVIRETEHFFLDLEKLEPLVLQYLEDGIKDHWRSNVLRFSHNYVKGGLKPRPITRDLEWGIPVPLEGYDGKCLYVWFEAVIGYLSASIEWATLTGDPEAWKAWWYDSQALTYYFIGKDNIPFHTIIWPAELIGIERLYATEGRLNLPYDVPANEFMNIHGAKAAKSGRNEAVSIPDLLENYDPDAIRYYLSAAMPETSDSDFSLDDLVQRNNSELVGIWGNLVNRVLAFTAKHFAAVPEPGAFDAVDEALLAQARAAFDAVGQRLAAAQFRAALVEALNLAREANRYLEVKSPWTQIKTDRQASGTSLYVALQAINALKVLLAPFLPFSAQQLHGMLGYQTRLFGVQYIEEIPDAARPHTALRYDRADADARWAFTELEPGRPLEKPAPLFKKLEEIAAES
ncbi:MAG: methionine--tRNA ligase [Anaerolineae bacterium]|jgi:methionyl-tRNA synthetase|nr:methionine--tRNA ligase [Anaerolineae bacterium]